MWGLFHPHHSFHLPQTSYSTILPSNPLKPTTTYQLLPWLPSPKTRPKKCPAALAYFTPLTFQAIAANHQRPRQSAPAQATVRVLTYGYTYGLGVSSNISKGSSNCAYVHHLK